MDKNKSISYKDSGVDKEAGYRSVELMKKYVKKTFTKGVLTDLGGFGGLFALDKNAYEKPVLVSGTDGVGTKLMIAFMADIHNTVGEDCVAMCVNDILCQGATPLFFLDYIATGKIIPEKITSIIEGIANGCKKSGAALIGGETAEMPGLYGAGDYDMAGFSVGIADRDKIIDGSKISDGDILIGLPSNGLHSNGFSLVRKILFDHCGYKIDDYVWSLGKTLAEELLRPTSIYVESVLPLIKTVEIKGMAHITGGGFYENIPRMLPKNYRAKVDIANIVKQPIFQLLQDSGNVDLKEMYGTFNMGVGLVMAVNANDVDTTINELQKKDMKPVVIGHVEEGEHGIDVNIQ